MRLGSKIKTNKHIINHMAGKNLAGLFSKEMDIGAFYVVEIHLG